MTEVALVSFQVISLPIKLSEILHTTSSFNFLVEYLWYYQQHHLIFPTPYGIRNSILSVSEWAYVVTLSPQQQHIWIADIMSIYHYNL